MDAGKLGRRGVTAIIAIALGVGPAGAAGASTPKDAADAVAAFNIAYWSASVPMFYRWNDHSHRLDWPLGEDFDVILDAYERTGSAAYRTQIDQIYTYIVSANGWGPTGGWATKLVYDDAIWTLLPMLRAYQITGDTKWLTPAVAEWDHVYNEGHTADLGGGIWWEKGWPLKSANTNGGAAIAGFQIFDITGDTTYRTKALGLVDWMIGHLYNPSTGQVYNQMNSDGSVQANDWSYNYAIFIGALDAAYRQTRNPAYLNHALKVLDYVKNFDPARPANQFPGTNNMTQPSGLLSDEVYNINSAIFKQDLIRWVGRFIYNHDLTQHMPWLQFNAEVAWSHRNANNLMGWYTTSQTDPDIGGGLAASRFGMPSTSGKMANNASLPGVQALLAVPSDGSNVAPAATASASSVYQNSATFSAANVADRTLGQHGVGEWASNGAAKPWIRLDWTTPQRLHKVVLFDRMNAVDNAVSGTLTFSDGSTVQVNDIQAGGFGRSITFAPRDATWVKFEATGGAGINVGLSEFQAYAENDLAHGKPVTSSSVYGAGYSAANAVDNDRSTRFSTAGTFNNTEWFRIDLGSTQTFNTVEIDWEAAYAKNYSVAVSTDGTNYTTVANRSSIIHAGPTADQFTAVSARYVKITMTNGYRATDRNFSFWRVKVLNQS